MITPDPQSQLVFKFTSLATKTDGLRFTTAASAFNARDLLSSKMLTCAWRVSYSQDDQAGITEWVFALHITKLAFAWFYSLNLDPIGFRVKA